MPHPGFALPRASELGNFFLFGMQGSGKSTIIKGLLHQVFKRKCTALIYDEKGEYTELFLDEETCLLNEIFIKTIIFWPLKLFEKFENKLKNPVFRCLKGCVNYANSLITISVWFDSRVWEKALMLLYYYDVLNVEFMHNIKWI